MRVERCPGNSVGTARKRYKECPGRLLLYPAAAGGKEHFMYIKPFAVEEWMNEWEVGARYNIAETCVDSVSLDELFALTG